MNKIPEKFTLYSFVYLCSIAIKSLVSHQVLCLTLTALAVADPHKWWGADAMPPSAHPKYCPLQQTLSQGAILTCTGIE